MHIEIHYWRLVQIIFKSVENPKIKFLRTEFEGKSVRPGVSKSGRSLKQLSEKMRVLLLMIFRIFCYIFLNNERRFELYQ